MKTKHRRGLQTLFFTDYRGLKFIKTAYCLVLPQVKIKIYAKQHHRKPLRPPLPVIRFLCSNWLGFILPVEQFWLFLSGFSYGRIHRISVTKRIQFQVFPLTRKASQTEHNSSYFERIVFRSFHYRFSAFQNLRDQSPNKQQQQVSNQDMIQYKSNCFT